MNHGPRRTTCRWCTGPLTLAQMMRRRTYCSRSCAKSQFHAMHPDAAPKAGAAAAKAHRAQYIARLKRTLEECKTLGEAYRRGYYTGYTVGANGRRRRAKRGRAA